MKWSDNQSERVELQHAKAVELKDTEGIEATGVKDHSLCSTRGLQAPHIMLEERQSRTRP